jgi:hypothetical protein
LPDLSRSGVSAESKSLSRATLKNAPRSTAVFIENVGQFDPRVRYQVKIGAQTAWLTAASLVFDATRPTEGAAGIAELATRDPFADLLGPLPTSVALDPAKPPSRSFDRSVFSEDFVGTVCCSKVEGKGLRPGIYNYFQSNDSTKWRTNVHGYSEVVYRDVWPGIDIRIYGNGPDLEQEFIVQPGADLNRVHISYRGIDKIELAQDGSLQVDTAFGKLRETSPVIYQEIAGKRETVSGRFSLRTSTSYGFQVDSYKPEYALVVDPTLLYSTFLGGSAGDYAWNVFNTYFGYTLDEYAAGIAVDASGNAYVAGYTASTDFPTTTGAFQVSGSGGFVTKLNATGSALVYSTYLGPSISAVAVDSAGSVYVTGGGAGQTFPTTSSAYYPTDSSHHCNQDLFLTVLNSTGDKLTYSTCFGASAANPSALAVDSRGRAFIAGRVSGSVPTTPNAYQTSYPGVGSAAFVTVIDTTASGASSLLYSTYLGISGTGAAQGAYASGVTVDSFGNIYVAGYATAGFPVTAGAFQTSHVGDNSCYVPCEYNPCAAPRCHDAFVAKLNPLALSSGQSLIYSTYIGGAGEDTASGIAVDGAGNAYVTGTNYYGDLPVTPGAFSTTGSFGYSVPYAFVTKLNPAGSALVYSTYLRRATSGDGSTATAIGLDSLGDAYITGSTSAADFPVTPDAAQSAKGDPTHDFTDAFLTKLNASGSGLLYSSYLGGNRNDVANALAVDPAGDAYVAGYTESLTFPVTPFAFQPVLNPNPTQATCSANTNGRLNGCHGGDAFVTKFPLGSSATLSITSIVPVSGGNSGTVSPRIFGTGFHDGATAKLSCGGQSIPGTNLSVGTGGRFFDTTFSLTAAVPGKCDVVVTNPDGTSTTLSQAFTVQQGGLPNIQVYLSGVEARHVSHAIPLGPADALMIVTVSNTGNVDSPGGLVLQDFIPGYSLTSVSPAGATSLATLNADSEIAWSSPSLSAGSSQVFVSTTQTNAAPFASTVSVPSASFTPNSNLGPVLACMTDTLKCGAALTLLNVCAIGCAFSLEAPPVAATCYIACILGGMLGIIDECPGISKAAIASCLHQGTTSCSSGSGPAGGPVGANVGGAGSSCLPSPITVIAPEDPNNLVGPPGVGGQRWMTGAQALSYVVSYDNEPSATAPAQQVVVTQLLGPNVNLSTLTLLGITIPNGSTNIQIAIPAGSFNPAAGVDEFTTNVDLRPTQGLLVNVDARLNRTVRTLTWTFTSIDPTTGLPPFNPLVGFLPPGAAANVSFSVTPMPGLATGTQVAEQASVVFDGQAPMSTAIWTNTIDNASPVSHISALTTTQSCPNFRVAWSGSDGGSGLRGFSIYSSDNGGAFSPWLSNTTAAAGTFIGAVGHAYSFYGIAADLTGNMEPAKTSAEASTTVTAAGSCAPPSLSGQVLSSSHSGTTVTLSLQLTNTGFTAAQAVNINQITARALSGSGTVTLASPVLPAAVGPLGVGASTTVTLTLNVPTTVTRLSLTENGNLVDGASKSYSYSIAQTIIP